jgi:hypothetical protein
MTPPLAVGGEQVCRYCMRPINPSVLYVTRILFASPIREARSDRDAYLVSAICLSR